MVKSPTIGSHKTCQTPCFLSSPSPSPDSPQLCLHDERFDLLQLKQKHYHVSPYYNYHPLNSWKPNTDCCFWKGISCDGNTGHVVGLDLFNSSLHGSIHSNSSLFQLHQLQMLNLSWNHFDHFAPSGFERLSRLMHLNLSSNYFSGQIPSQLSQLKDLVSLDLSWNHFGGQIPSQISQLTYLVSLDLSSNQFEGQVPSEISKLTKLVFLDLSSLYGFSQLEIPNLGAFVQNLSMLRELRLDSLNLSAQENKYWCRRLSSALPNLQVLSMSYCSLTGPLDASISSLRFLSELSLDDNYNLSSTVPSSLMNLTSLTILSLGNCGLHGDFPSNVFLQPNLRDIALYDNPLLSVHFPEVPQVNTTLQYLDVGSTNFQGKFPSSVGKLKFLKELYLNDCNFFGPIPPCLANLTQLTSLYLSDNNFSGEIPSYFWERFPNLETLELGNNLLQGPLHSYLFFLPSLSNLHLSNNQFSGVVNEPIHNISSFSSPRYFDLSGNHLKGQDLMRSISKIKGTFRYLDLSFNDFGYIVEDRNLSSYDHSLSSNHRSGENLVFNAQILSLVMTSCNISKFPDFLIRNQKALSGLDISGNRITGTIPKLIWQPSLSYLNLSNNFFSGMELPLPNHSFNNLRVIDLHSNMIQECPSIVPSCFDTKFASPILGNLTSLLSEATFYFSISDNKLTGKIPFSICKATNLDILDLSKNQLSGNIPTCLGNSSLGVLNLENNKLYGPIPSTFKNGCNLHTLKLNKNKLQGKVPRSLGNCKLLTVLDIAENKLNDTFPYWLENLSELQVLVMRSNKFSGPIAEVTHVDSPFPNLHVIDLSFNKFTGSLPLQYICHWKAMMFDGGTSQLGYQNLKAFTTYYQDTVAIMEKGLYLNLQKILTAFTTVDLSNNNFKGNIPHALGNLKALKVLNLSGNSLTGQIPISLGNLSELESLDLSRNKLSGEIPRQLTSLTFLEVMNLSYNNFIGSIPQGRQFDTFTNASYEGNAGLCGLPLSRKCGVFDKALPPTSTSFQQNDDDSTSLLDWKFALAGYCSGLTTGLVIGQQLFWRKTRWFEFISRIVDERSALLELKQKHYLAYPDDDPLNSWRQNTDCCFWEGISCDNTTGHVVSLDLSDLSLAASIHFNSSLFHFHHLQMLNLSWNHFNYFAPSGFDRFTRLMHLNLSNNDFSGRIPSQIFQLTHFVSLNLSSNQFGGQIPFEISKLTKLAFLDLSNNYGFSQLEIPNLGAFVQNLSMLIELRLDGV
ncbi:receptor-like protein 33 [Macadamia integrifolia]|uniref:receptor-like protein 33 n=1 Tax=Macadamia integrifolia TaxID=60698 RepID=UPI001C4F146B|nr:receptor-like protein 33 [Macadamia integrifolia]